MEMLETTTKITDLKDTTITDKSKADRWKEEINSAEAEMKDFCEKGRKVVKRYRDDRKGELTTQKRKFNLFTTNVGIMQSALYSKPPKVSVTRKFFDANDDVARVASNILQRALTQDLDEDCCLFNQVMEDAVEDRLVPGMGCAWLRLETETAQIPAPASVMPSAQPYIDLPDAEATEELEEVTHQEIIIEHVHWEDFLYSPCRTWAERRWVARRVYMDRDSVSKRFGEEVGKIISLDYSPKHPMAATLPVNDLLNKATIYEIWDRQTRTVLWLHKSYPTLLDEREDPLKLENFEPCPKPLFALTTTSNCVPVADYYLLQDQYSELDTVNERISVLHEAVKVIGVYDKQADGVSSMLTQGADNRLIPVDNWAMFAEKGGLKGQIDWLPLDTVINALQSLRQAREDIKGQIYELNGIADIVRGSTKASETLGAQQIKANFANIRIQRLQSGVGRFAGEIFRIKAQILVKHFTPEMILKMSGIQYTDDANNPELIVEAMKLVTNDEQFEWRISVDSDSMKMADYAQEKQERAEFVTSVATYLQSAGSIIKESPDAAPLLIGMLKYATAGAPGSKDMEALIDKFSAEMEQKAKNPAPPPPDPEVEKAKAQAEIDSQKAQQDMQMKQQDMQLKLEQAKMDAQIKMQELQMTQQQSQQELMMQQEEHRMKMEFMLEEHELKMAQLQQEGQLKLSMQQDKAEQDAEIAEDKAEQAATASKETKDA